MQDLFLGTGLAIAFIVPLRKGMRVAQADQLAQAQGLNIELTLQITILTAVLVMSTVLLVFLVLLAVPFAKCLFSVGALISVICIMLMTPYYRDKYFQRLCCLCIGCYKRCGCCKHVPGTGTPVGIPSATASGGTGGNNVVSAISISDGPVARATSSDIRI